MAHRRTFYSAYLEYLRQTEALYRNTVPALYARFEAKHAEERASMTQGLLRNPDKVLVGWESEQCRLEAFAEFFARQPVHPVLSFWRWDAQLNPKRLRDPELDHRPIAATAATGR